ncbi:MAG: DNA polymerase III subunit delta [Bacteroidota bacterium]|nr:DNA polymerase III subunit delta [Bacteroidota bacterium]
MATATLKQIKDSISHKDLAHIYLLTGEEPYYIDLLANKFEQEVISEEAKDFNFNVLYGKDAVASMIIGMCRQYPLMADKRLVILKEAQMLDKGEWAKLSVYFSKPQPSTCFVICNKNKTFDTKTQNLISKSGGVIFESKREPDYKLANWIKAYIKEIGYTADEQAISFLESYLGNNLEKITNELAKLRLNLKDKKHISDTDVSSYIGISKDYNVFELQKALSQKQVLKCNQIIRYFAKNPKENPIQMILPSLFSFFVNVLACATMKGKNISEIASALHSTAYRLKDCMTATNYYSVEKLFYIVSLFEDYDLRTKGINVSPLCKEEELLKELVFKILH